MRKIISKIMLVTMLVVAIIPLTAKAGLQANKGGTSYKTDYWGDTKIYANDLFIGARNMETAGGTLGKEATLDATKYTDKTEGGNGIDCHMAKNTEWGTAAMLAASDYGEAPSGQSNESTTKNESGIYQMADSSYELTAGIWTGKGSAEGIGTIAKADSRYYDLYSEATSIPGDATTETTGWRGSSGDTFITSGDPIFCRSWKSLFGFWNYDGYNAGISYAFNAGTRAVAVCGQGL